jgi:hypothetical protein
MSFLHRIFNWIVLVPLALIGIGFAVANRQWIGISFDPFNRAHPLVMVNMPLWALFFCGVFVGILAGWLVAWAGNRKYRKATRAAKMELVRTQQQFERDKREMAASKALVPRQDTAA